ncbi:MAG: hybrid sensor histidine kinase/response regulator [Desulfobacteraceae bacterium]|jgi:signal transduction histidine kinase
MNFLEKDNQNETCQSSQIVLFVDDEEDILKALRRALRSEPYQQYFVSSGEEALEFLSRHTIHVLVSDMRMPHMDGGRLLEIVAQRYPDIVRMVISGWADADSIIEAINSGHIYRYIVKPWDSRELKITLRQALEMYRMQAERREIIKQLKDKNSNLEKVVLQRAQQVMAVNQRAEMGKYAAQMVHNLKEPLNNLSTSIELIGLMTAEETFNLNRLRKEVSIAQREIDKLKQLSTGFVSHTQEEKTVQISLVDINKIIQEEMDYFELDPVFCYEIKRELKLASNLPQIMGNTVQLKQILNNLIKNAVASMATASKKHLCIETTLQANAIVILVSDTGTGIAPENYSRIFSNDLTNRLKGDGSGLGLYTTKSLVAAYSGSIDFTSTLQIGTTFRVSLPVGRPIINPSVSLH